MRELFTRIEDVDWDLVVERDVAAEMIGCSPDRVRTKLGESGRAVPKMAVKHREMPSLWWRDRVMDAVRLRDRMCVVCDRNVVARQGGRVCASPRCLRISRAQKVTTENEKRITEKMVKPPQARGTLKRADERVNVVAALNRLPGSGLTTERVFAVSRATGLRPVEVISIARSYGRGVIA